MSMFVQKYNSAIKYKLALFYLGDSENRAMLADWINKEINFYTAFGIVYLEHTTYIVTRRIMFR